MEKNEVKSMDILTYHRRPRRGTSEVVEVEDTNSNHIVSALSGVCRNEILNPCSNEQYIAASTCAHQERKCIQEAEMLNSYSLSSPSLLGAFPRRQRSNRRVICKNLTKVQISGFCGDEIMKQHPSHLHPAASWHAHQKSRSKQEDEEMSDSKHHLGQPHFSARWHARRKRRSKQEDEKISDSELILPSTLRAFHFRGQLRRRVNYGNIINRQQGKLDTNMFDCYLENLWRSFPEEKKNSITYLDCLWFSLYTKEPSKEKVLNWIKRKHIFSKKYVFIPIVQWQHWSLLIFCHFGESLQSTTNTPCMLLLDSLQMENPKRLEPGIRKFVLDIFKAEERPENKKLIYRIPFLVPKVPQQRNGEECGNYVLYYINLFVESAPENFSVSEGYPYFIKEDWFTPEGLECFCKNLISCCK